MGRGRFLVALAWLGAAACARQSEFIGRLQAKAGSPPADRDAAIAEAPLPAEAPAAAAPAGCPNAAPVAPSLPAPAWNCGATEGRCWREPAVDPAPFAGATEDTDVMRRPALVYPIAGSVHPPNLATLTVQWRRGNPAQTFFRIRLAAPAAGGEPPTLLYLPYVMPTGPTPTDLLDVAYRIPEAIWRYLGERHAGRELGITVSAFDPGSNRIATSSPTTIRFAPAPVEGGFFYLGTEGPSAGIQRHVFGARGVEPVVKPRSASNAFDCGGCHSLSRDGTTLAFAATYAGNLTVSRTDDLENPLVRPRPSPPDEANAVSPAVSPDGRYVLARDGVSGSLVLYNARSRAIVSAAPLAATGGRIDFPEWSADGRSIVATRATGAEQPRAYSATDGHVVVLPFVPETGELGPPETIAYEPLEVHAHPSWSPDGQWIVFASSPVGAESHRNPRTRLRLVSRRGPPIFTLGQASPDGVASTFPKFAPAGQNGCNLLFISFQSRMDYGVLRRNSTTSEGGWSQLWMSAVDLTRLPADPSSPPLWLPFQDVGQMNLLPVWSEPLPCAASATCGAGASCIGGRCAPSP